MAQYIDKSALVAEIKKRIKEIKRCAVDLGYSQGCVDSMRNILFFIDTLEVKEVDEQKERMNECPFRQVGCAMYEGHILECKGACSWVVDYPKLKELKAQKGE